MTSPVADPTAARRAYITDRLRALGITHQAIADRVGCSRGVVSNVIGGRYKKAAVRAEIALHLGEPTDKLWELSRYLGTSAEEISARRRKRNAAIATFRAEGLLAVIDIAHIRDFASHVARLEPPATVVVDLGRGTEHRFAYPTPEAALEAWDAYSRAVTDYAGGA